MISQLEYSEYEHGLLEYTDGKTRFIDVFLLGPKIHFAITLERDKLFTYFFHYSKDNLVGY